MESLSADALIDVSSTVVPPPKPVDPALFLAAPVKASSHPGRNTDKIQPASVDHGVPTEDINIVTPIGSVTEEGKVAAADSDEVLILSEEHEHEHDESGEGTDQPRVFQIEHIGDDESSPIVPASAPVAAEAAGDAEDAEYEAYKQSVQDSDASPRAENFNPFNAEDEKSGPRSSEDSVDSLTCACKVQHLL